MKSTFGANGRIWKTAALIAVLGMTALAAIGQNDWPAYGHNPGGAAFSPLKQITPENVKDLHIAWVYNTGETAAFFEATPIVVDGVMYVSTPNENVVAISALTGKQIWKFDTHMARSFHQRGVSYWPGDAQHGPRVIAALTNGNLYALDAKTGKLIPTFGNKGVVDLNAGLVTPALPNPRVSPTSPPVIYKNLIILGQETQEGPSYGTPGDPRAFDVITGKQVWRFHSVPRPGEANFGTWGGNWKNRAGPSDWGPLTVDAQRGLVFVPTGNPAANMWGGDRPGKNLYSSSILCLRADTGTLVWYFQLVHHDMWDYDVAAAPVLITVNHGGQKIPAVVASGKDGMMFILNELTGKSIYGVEERPVPKSDAPGEHSWPTQPFPIKPQPLVRLSITAKQLSKVTPQSEKYCAALFSKYHNDGPFTPYGTKPTVVFPGTIGGPNWRGPAFNPELGYIFINVQNIGALGQMAPTSETQTAGGAAPPFSREIQTPSRGQGRGRAPAAPPAAGRGGRGAPRMSQSSGLPVWNLTAYARFRDQDNYPCNEPPWGQLIAVNANTGDFAWKSVLGFYPGLKAKGVPDTGTPNMAGPIATAGGLVFMGGTLDHRVRAFGAKTGKELWSFALDGYSDATPLTYRGSNGKQYVVFTDGSIGPFLGTFMPSWQPHEGKIVAFALPPIPAVAGNAAAIAAVEAGPSAQPPAPAFRFPVGSGRDLVMAKCTTCHSLGSFTNQRRSGQQWSATISGMVTMGMSATAPQIAQLTDYLTAQLGQPVNVNQATASQLENGLLLSAKDAQQIVNYRARQGSYKSLSDVEKVPGIDTAQIELQRANFTF